ncbi:hypothetical protein [Aureliella helgolandensis]|nr:hypothetical protein [Aureliella helgolandensis]
MFHDIVHRCYERRSGLRSAIMLATRNGSGSIQIAVRAVQRPVVVVLYVVSFLVCQGFPVQSAAWGKDYLFTLAGGYSPEGNQASLEANVLFLQDILASDELEPVEHSIFFSDGFDDTADVQIVDPSDPTLPVTDLLKSLYSLGRQSTNLDYRDHQIPNIAGPLEPSNIKAAMQRVVSRLTAGDRLLIYVTAHGSAATGRNQYNTSINCWDRQFIHVKEFSTWLDEVPPEVPTIMVMAQCYAGGFAHSIFDRGNQRNGLAKNLRVGFFAQQHDLAAAGCRPDIENDEEYSSYFWGALVGRSRTGHTIHAADFDQDGVVTFSEAHGHAILASNTIDIPLRTTDALLRVYSRIDQYQLDDSSIGGGGSSHSSESENADEEADSLDFPLQEPASATSVGRTTAIPISSQPQNVPKLHSMSGTLNEICEHTSPATVREIQGLAQQLQIELTEEVTVVFDRYQELRQGTRRSSRFRGGRRSRGRSSGRRQLREAIGEQWPDLGASDHWRDSPLLAVEGQAELMDSIQQLPAYKAYSQAQLERQATNQERELLEVQQVKYQRLIFAMETALLAKNLPHVAPPEVLAVYESMQHLEQSSLHHR